LARRRTPRPHFGRYPALLVSLHTDTIYALTFNFAKASPENAEAVRAFLDEQHRFQAQTAASLRADPKIAEQASPDTIERNRLLIGGSTIETAVAVLRSCAHLDASNVVHPDNRTVGICAQDDGGEFLRARQSARGLDGDLKLLLIRDWRRAHPKGLTANARVIGA
jgi:hypothetical protein